MTCVLTLAHIKKNFGERCVLKDVSLSVHQGEVVSIIGPSGAGKTTLLRCATLLETVDDGDLSYGDFRACTAGKYAKQQQLKEAHAHFGLVFQSFNLFPHFSIYQNIMDAPLHVQKREKAKVMQETDAILKKIGLEGYGNAYPCQLSGGQQQRVAIARALALHPDILFFDEPTSALDMELTQDVLKIIRQLAEEKMTMVIVTHEIDFARDVSDRIIFMANGIVVEDGSPEELLQNPKNERTRQFLTSKH